MANKDGVVSQTVQDSFCYLAITNTKFLRMARQSVKPSYFSSQVTEDVISICYAYFDQFKESPDSNFQSELLRFLNGKSDDDKQLYVNYLKRLQEIDKPNEAYVVSRINSFIRAREFEVAAIKFVELTKAGEFEKAKRLMHTTLKAGIEKEEVGIRYFNGGVPTYYDSESNSTGYLMGTGFDVLDKAMPRGLRRTDVLLVLGGYKGKKSFSCIHFGCEALMHGLKVLHISHELSEEETEMRYDRMIGGLTGYNKDQQVEIEHIDDDGNVFSTERMHVGSVFDLKEVTQARRRVARYGGELIIRKYPMGFCTMDEIVRYLDYLETYEGFIPDVVINDYIEKMRLPTGMERRDAINEYYLQSKGIADDRKLLMITVSQVTRDALRRRTLNQKDSAEDIRKIGNVDLVIGISQTKAQSMENRMQAVVLANRTGVQDVGCVFATNLDIGQLVIKCWPMKVKSEESEDGD
jgi:hypothetical protein